VIPVIRGCVRSVGWYLRLDSMLWCCKLQVL